MNRKSILQKGLVCALALSLAAGITACGAAESSSAPSEASSQATSQIVSSEITSRANSQKEAKAGTLLLSVNPEIEIDYDKDGKVTDVDGLNKDAKALGLREKDYIGRDCKTVVRELVKKISAAGYFENTIDGHTKNIVIKLDPDSKLPGKTFLRDVQAEADKAISEAKLQNDAIVVTGEDQDQKGNIGLSKAKEIVLSQLDIQKADFYDHEYELDDGVYEFDFTVNGVEYEYEVDARTGKVLKADIEHNDDWKDRETWKQNEADYDEDDPDDSYDDDRDDNDPDDDVDDRDDEEDNDHDDVDDDRDDLNDNDINTPADVDDHDDDDVYEDDRDDIDDDDKEDDAEDDEGEDDEDEDKEVDDDD